MNPARLIRALLIAACLISVSGPAFGQIVTSRHRRPSQTWSPKQRFTFGSGIEFQTDSEQTQWDFPFLAEYNLSEFLKVAVEPNFVYIDSKTPDVSTVGGFGDLETSAEYEFLLERRYRPALTAIGVIKWPTASNADLGDPGTDYSLGLIVSKDFVYFDADLTALYTFVGDPELQNAVEISLAGEVELTHLVTLEGEILVSNSDTIRGQPGTIGGLGRPLGGGDLNQGEGTIGVAEYVTHQLKLEEGFVYASDNSWQIIFAWEWSGTGD